jgi:lipopolysaccharide/colanic/teichoic acid biosynthesis glycosyltransferase
MESTIIVREALKRFLDFAVATTLLIVFSVPLMLIAVALKLELRGPVLFKQERTGKDGKVFTLYKLRSMRISKEQGDIFHEEQAVTRVGKFIRRWRIDEMPQFINVLKGDMSIVGPRPTLPYQIERYDPEQRRRLDVKPGLTGWSQIHGDSAISWPDRIDLDLWYVDNWSLWLDLKIILLTPFALLRIRKINAEEGPPPDEISELPADDDQVEG